MPKRRSLIVLLVSFAAVLTVVGGLAYRAHLRGEAGDGAVAPSNHRLQAAQTHVGGIPAGSESRKPPSEERSPFQVELKQDGTFALHYKQVPLVNAEYRFWEADWKWAGATAKLGALHDGAAPLSVLIPELDTQITGTVANPAPNVLSYDLTLKRGADRAGVIGGGLEFVLNLKSACFDGGTAPRPELLANNEGWQWPLPSGRSVRVVFFPPAEKVFFEKNNVDRIRAFFLGESFHAGASKIRMTVTLPEGTLRKPTQSEEYGPDDTSRWLADVFPYPHAPVDLSHLNHPPGKHGFVRAVGERLEFEDGTPVRFWGINVMAHALFAPDDQIARHARRLAMLGFNLVRLHHHDTTGWVKPTIINKQSESSRFLDQQGLDRIDYWIKCLRDNGIYVWLDLHSYRQFREGDRITDLGKVVTFSEFAHQKPQAGEVKGFCQYDAVLQKLMVELQEKYVSHVNRYTRLAYKDDPAVAFVLLTNENDITHHYGNKAIPASGNAELNRLFNERAHLFAEKTGLSERAVLQPWSPGPAKLFLNDQEYAFGATLRDSLHRLGSRSLVAAGNMWGDMPLSSIAALTAGDVIDVHQYCGPGVLEADPRQIPNIAQSIGINQVAGKPLTVSEWNIVDRQELAVDRFAAPLYIASIAALQSWDALMLYGYSQSPLADQIPLPGVWDAVNDPALMAAMPAAALLFRNGHVAPAKTEYCLTLSRDQLFGPPLKPANCAAARTLMEQSRFTLGIPSVPELEWLEPTKLPERAIAVSNPEQSFLAKDAHAVTSDTGELTRDWEAGVQTIDTAKTQAAQGALDGHEIRLADVQFRLETRHAMAAVSSLDDRPIRTSERILITTVARAVKPTRPQKKTNGRPDLTVYSEPVRGVVIVEAMPGLEAVALSSRGQETALKDATYQNGRHHLPLDKTLSHWYLLRKPKSP